MFVGIPLMQLQDHSTVEHELLVLGAAVTAGQAKRALIPSARIFNICDGDKRLREHGVLRYCICNQANVDAHGQASHEAGRRPAGAD